MDATKSTLKKIWVTDDDLDDRNFFVDVVAQVLPSVTVTTFSNGDLLLEALELSGSPDLMFIDLNMPGKNGFDCLKIIRSNPALNNMPVVIYSSSSFRRDIDDAYKFGANLYYIKPDIYQGFVSEMKKLLSMNWDDLHSISSKRYINNEFVTDMKENNR